MKVGEIHYSDVFGSHVIVLAAAVARTTGPILELGAGEYSTPMLHELGKVLEREIVTVERHPAWAARFSDLSSPTHLFTGSLEEGFDAHAHYSVALIDGDAGDRTRSVAALRRKCRYLLVHDTEPEQAGHYPALESVLASFKYRTNFDRGTPWTTIVSDVTPW